MTSTITKETAAGNVTPGMLDQFADELAAATGIRCRGSHVQRGRNLADQDDPTKDHLVIFFDSPPIDAQVDAAIAAFPALPASVGDQFAATANVPEHVEIVALAPGEHVGLQVTLSVSLAGPPSKDGIVRALVPVWREPGGAVEIGQPLRDASSRIVGVALDFAVQQLSGADVGVAISFTQRASGTVRVLALDVQELYRKDLP